MFSGSIVALITPMDSKGQIDKTSLKKLVDYHVESGTSAIVSMGTTGESATLDHKEHIDVIKQTVEFADGRIPVIAGTGANATREAIMLTQDVHNTNVVGCLSVTPYYNRPTQEGLYQHFKMIAENTTLPQILYNVPSRTGCDMQPETVARLAKIPNIVGLKEASGDLTRVSKIRQLTNKNFILLSGDDATSFDFMILGGDGVISVTANIAAKALAQICKLLRENKVEEARAINNKIMPLHYKLFVESNPIPVKWVCKRLGLINNGSLRLPLTALNHQLQPVVEQALKVADLI